MQVFAISLFVVILSISHLNAAEIRRDDKVNIKNFLSSSKWLMIQLFIIQKHQFNEHFIQIIKYNELFESSPEHNLWCLMLWNIC